MLVHENINFERDQDPLKSMGMGLYHVRIFDTVSDAVDYLIKIIPAILGKEKIPNDLYQEHSSLNNKYWQIINEYQEEYIKPSERSYSFREEVFWELWNRLKEDYLDTYGNFKKRISESQNFERHKDPFKQLNIGMQKTLKDPEFRKKMMSESQNFVRKPLDIETLGIGLEATINEFMEDHSPEQPGSWVYDILQNSDLELDEETRKKWAQFLIKIPQKYATEDDENLYYALEQANIEWIPYLPIMGNDFGYTVEGDKYFIHFGGWLDFRDLFDTHSRDVSLEFIGAVLCGEDSYQLFERDFEDDDITEWGWYLKKTNEKKNIPALEDLKNAALEMGANKENVNTIDDLLNEINDNEDLEPLKEAVQKAFSETQSVADEDACLKSLQRAIMNHFDLKQKPEYNEKEILVGEISKKGLKHLSYTVATGEDKIKWSQPSGSAWMGDWDSEVVNDALYNAMGDIE